MVLRRVEPYTRVNTSSFSSCLSSEVEGGAGREDADIQAFTV